MVHTISWISSLSHQFFNALSVLVKRSSVYRIISVIITRVNEHYRLIHFCQRFTLILAPLLAANTSCLLPLYANCALNSPVVIFYHPRTIPNLSASFDTLSSQPCLTNAHSTYRRHPSLTGASADPPRALSLSSLLQLQNPGSGIRQKMTYLSRASPKPVIKASIPWMTHS